MTRSHSRPSDPVLMDVTTSLTRMSRAYRQAADGSLAELGLSTATAWPVVIVGRMGDGVRQKVVAEELGIEAPSLVRLLDQLEANGFLARKDDPDDRRAKTLHLTKLGRAVVADVEALLVDLRRRIFEGVSREDADTFLRVLDTLKSGLAAVAAGKTETKAAK